MDSLPKNLPMPLHGLRTQLKFSNLLYRALKDLTYLCPHLIPPILLPHTPCYSQDHGQVSLKPIRLFISFSIKPTPSTRSHTTFLHGSLANPISDSSIYTLTCLSSHHRTGSYPFCSRLCTQPTFKEYKFR